MKNRPPHLDEMFASLKEAAAREAEKRQEKDRRKPPKIFLPGTPLTDAEKYARDVTPKD